MYRKVVSLAFDLLVKVALTPCSANLLLGTDLILLELGPSSLVGEEEEDELLEVVGELLMEVGVVV